MLVELDPSLTAEPGVGLVCAAQIICVWSHRGRVRSDAAFTAFAGVAPSPPPLEASPQTAKDRQAGRRSHDVGFDVDSGIGKHEVCRDFATGDCPRPVPIFGSRAEVDFMVGSQ